MNRRTAVAALLGLALAVAGCSGDPPRGGGAGTAATAPAPTTTAPAPTTTTTTRAAAPVRYRFPVAGCRARYGNSHHDYPAADMFTGRGCAFVAPVAGRVDEVTRTDTWRQATDEGADRGGRSVSLVGVDGVRYYGSHLEAVAAGIAPGTRVRAGQVLGRIGNSGSARVTAVHLHFGISWPTRPGIWWVRRGMVPPARYLDAWRAGDSRSPVRAVRAARAEAGREVPACQARC
ncbi:MAG TPA: M23 family metallopeptidase [Actinomycetota bacterium]|jgi:murein DD-endopeptidase MepM/ murein hydrolase activator NlpD|nr:M23 family metallopeptidase [Actinomycetota bacterium]